MGNTTWQIIGCYFECKCYIGGADQSEYELYDEMNEQMHQVMYAFDGMTLYFPNVEFKYNEHIEEYENRILDLSFDRTNVDKREEYEREFEREYNILKKNYISVDTRYGFVKWTDC